MKLEFEPPLPDFQLQITSVCTGRTCTLRANRLQNLYREHYLRMAENSNFEMHTPFGKYDFETIETREATIIKLSGQNKLMAVAGVALHNFHSDFVWQQVLRARSEIFKGVNDENKDPVPVRPTRLPWVAIAAFALPPIERGNGKKIHFETSVWPLAIGIVSYRICNTFHN